MLLTGIIRHKRHIKAVEEFKKEQSSIKINAEGIDEQAADEINKFTRS
jgi:hypothetical protein